MRYITYTGAAVILLVTVASLSFCRRTATKAQIDSYRACQESKKKDVLVEYRDGNKIGYKDGSGSIVIKAEYDSAPPQFEFETVQARRGSKWGVIDRDGNVVVPFMYEGTKAMREGLAPVQQDGKWGYVDKDNKVVIEFRYDYAGPFCDGTAAVGHFSAISKVITRFADVGWDIEYQMIDRNGRVR